MTAPAAELSPEQITARSGSNFLVSFARLEPERRRGFTAVYAFCRVVDDAVDEAAAAAEGKQHLDFWSRELDLVYGGEPHTAVGRALQDAVRRFGIAKEHLQEIVAGMRMDLEPPCYDELPDLERYCFKVASAVGLACLPVMGAAGPAAERYADRLGLALQLTNILRDVQSDAAQGRVYLPRRRLARAAVEPAWLDGSGPAAAYAAGGPVDRVVQELADVAEQRFAEAAEALPDEHRRALLPAQIMAAVYRDLLRLVRRRGGDLRDGRRLSVPRWRKLWLAMRARRKGS